MQSLLREFYTHSKLNCIILHFSTEKKQNKHLIFFLLGNWWTGRLADKEKMRNLDDSFIIID